jgi:hypothetical protein
VLVTDAVMPRVDEIWREVKTGRRVRIVHVGAFTPSGRPRIAVRNCETERLSYIDDWRFNAQLVRETRSVTIHNGTHSKWEMRSGPKLTGSCVILADVAITCWLCGTMTTPNVEHRCEVK